MFGKSSRKNIRYQLAPQMRDYDRMKEVWLPHLMYFHSPCFRSEAVNTDRDGFRLTGPLKESVFADPTQKPVSLLAGNSTAFGVGATADAQTIPAHLQRITGENWLNFAGRSFSSTQEFLLFLYFYPRLPKIRNVVIFSGFTNISLFYRAWEYCKQYGIFFSWNRFNKLLNQREDFAKTHPLLNRLIPSSYKNRLDLSAMTPRQVLKAILKGAPVERQPQSLEPFFIKVTDPKREKGVLLPVIEHDLRNWRMLADVLGFEVSYVLQPLIQWTGKQFSPEEEKLIADIDRHPAMFWRVFRDYMDEAEHQWLSGETRRLCEQFSIPYYDMSKLMSGKDLDRQWLFVDRPHLSDRGSKLAAELIAEHIL